jgi:voltage-gated potassium channel
MAGTKQTVTMGEMVSGAMAELGPAKGRLGRDEVALVKSVPLFADLSSRHVRKLLADAERARYGPGRTVVRQGARGDAFFVIAEGEANVVHDGKTIGRLGSGAFFGEMALLTGEPRSASVVTTAPTTAIRIGRTAFNKVLDHDPAIARAIMAEMARRLRRLEANR